MPGAPHAPLLDVTTSNIPLICLLGGQISPTESHWCSGKQSKVCAVLFLLEEGKKQVREVLNFLLWVFGMPLSLTSSLPTCVGAIWLLGQTSIHHLLFMFFLKSLLFAFA
jgi:hypothetical protein